MYDGNERSEVVRSVCRGAVTIINCVHSIRVQFHRCTDVEYLESLSYDHDR